MKTRVGLWLLGLLLAVSVSAAPVEWGCEGNDVQFQDQSPWESTPLESPPPHVKVTKNNTVTFGPFDTTRYGFRYVDLVALPDAPHTAGIPEQKDVARVPYFLVRLRSGSRVIWWQMTLDHRFGPPFEGWEPDKADLELAAAPDVPLFLLSYAHVSYGASTSWTWEDMVILDFRDMTPQVLTHLYCGVGAGGGVCGAPDMGYGDHHSYRCQWSDEETDFLCAHTLIHPGHDEGGDRAFRSCFLLERDDDVSCPRDTASGPSDLQQFAEWLRRGKTRVGDSHTFPGAGTVRAMAVFQGRNGATHWVLAGPGAAGGSDFRFYLATTRRGSPASFSVLDWLTVDCTAELEVTKMALPNELETGTPVDPPPGFELVGNDLEAGFHLLRLVVKEGEATSLVWVGIDTRRQPPKAEALLLATDSAYHLGCNQFYLPPQLAPRGLRVSPFRAELAFLEGLKTTPADDYTPWCPPYEMEDYTEADPPTTPTHAVLAWDPDDGFMLEVTRRSPDTLDRWGVTRIDSKGNVTFERRLP